MAQHILNVTPETLRSVVELALSLSLSLWCVSEFKLVADNAGQHIEHVLRQSHKILKPIWWTLFMRFLTSGHLFAVEMSYRNHLDDSLRWRAIGKLEAGQSQVVSSGSLVTSNIESDLPPANSNQGHHRATTHAQDR
ncbi:hypothetical protein TNCV_35511 [Trichonephila clavipes]|nr:hypothetical protein TNCV_35511 [Trichonephila clavipes]